MTAGATELTARMLDNTDAEGAAAQARDWMGAAPGPLVDLQRHCEPVGLLVFSLDLGDEGRARQLAAQAELGGGPEMLARPDAERIVDELAATDMTLPVDGAGFNAWAYEEGLLP